ncbi:hypothetical protein [Deinococcus ruber]|uniref:hypothetical protein n=1 Tax=Deinococcus ruber TaxID=1848197 RepID=UPI00166BE385|nr:hypothetical protein [Deinococcus ruber]
MLLSASTEVWPGALPSVDDGWSLDELVVLLERDGFTWKLAAIPAGSGWRYWGRVFHPLWPAVMHVPKQQGGPLLPRWSRRWQQRCGG